MHSCTCTLLITQASLSNIIVAYYQRDFWRCDFLMAGSPAGQLMRHLIITEIFQDFEGENTVSTPIG